MTEAPFPASPETPDDAPGDRRRLMILGGGIGVIAIAAIGGYALLSGGSSSSDTSTALPVVHHVAAAASPAASASPKASASGEAVLHNFHGDVGVRDPFAVPAAVLAATSPAPAAPAPAAAAPAAAAAAAAIPAASAALPTTIAGPGSTTVSVVPGSGTTPTTVTVAPMADEYLQLLASHHQADGSWTVDVRSASGVVKAVKPGTKNVAGTLFYYDGEDETSGAPTFVFELGESKGGNLKPNAKESSKHVHADKSTLVLHDGNVDGGVYAE